MSDRFATQIDFGGPVTEEQLQRIAELAADCTLSTNNEQVYETEFIFQALLKQMADDYTYFELTDPDLVTDVADALKDYLQEQGIPYNIRVDARYEYEAELHWWRPGMVKEGYWGYLSQAATVTMVSLEYLEKALKHGAKLKTIVKRLRKIPPPMVEGIIVVAKTDTTIGGVKGVDVRKVKP